MTEAKWAELDRTIADLFVNSDPALDLAMQASGKAGLPDIEVSPPYAKLLFLLARMIGARKILEIGTLGGYSTICMARALPQDGRLITLEYDPKHTEVARMNIERAGLSGIVEVRLGFVEDEAAALPEHVEREVRDLADAVVARKEDGERSLETLVERALDDRGEIADEEEVPQRVLLPREHDVLARARLLHDLGEEGLVRGALAALVVDPAGAERAEIELAA